MASVLAKGSMRAAPFLGQMAPNIIADCVPVLANARAAILLPQPGLVLEPDLDPLGLGQTGYVGRECAGKVFLNASITC